MNQMTAAHPSLPLDTSIRVTSLATGRSVVVTINDRGPYVDGRIIDLSAGAAEALGIKHRGIAPVRVEVLGRAVTASRGSDRLFREFTAYRDRRAALLQAAGLSSIEERDALFREFLSFAEETGGDEVLFAEFMTWLESKTRPPQRHRRRATAVLTAQRE
jgi:rare lipoprotein A (peptidoglycan hydrolase)